MKAEEMKKKLEAHEEKKAVEAKKFDPKELIADTKKIRHVNVPGIGIVSYGVLTLGDLKAINKAGTDEEKAGLVLWKMLQKADPKLKYEDVAEFSLQKAVQILTAIAGPLEQQLKKLQPGLKSMQKLNYTA